MPLITRKLEFDAGHRVLGHEGKCATLHGHRYTAELSVSSVGLDTCGRVIDFSVVKGIVGKWIDDRLDHTMVLHPDDPLLGVSDVSAIIGPRRPFIMPADIPNPTAENMSELIFRTAKELLRDEVVVEAVKLYETPNCWALVERSNR